MRIHDTMQRSTKYQKTKLVVVDFWWERQTIICAENTVAVLLIMLTKHRKESRSCLYSHGSLCGSTSGDNKRCSPRIMIYLCITDDGLHDVE